MERPKISVMQITNRFGNIDILWADLRRQTEQDFELVLVDALWREREQEVKDYINDPRLKYIRQNDKVEGTYTNLAHADNQGFNACRGDLIVLLQDYIWIPPTSLEKFYAHYLHDPTRLVTGVGHQYKNPTAEDIVDPKGKITVFKEPYKGKPFNQCWTDPRMRLDQGTFCECNPQDWEMNYASIPRKILSNMGGMDERFDAHGFAWDNVYLAMVADFMGYKTFIDQTNECFGFDHDGWWPNPLKVNRISPAEYYHEQIGKIRRGEISPRLNFVRYDDNGGV